MTASTVYVVRHGQTPWTASGRVQGWAPVPLNETGVEQVTATAAHLDEVLDTERVRVVSSDIRRAAESADIVAAELHGVSSVDHDRRWRERNFGVFQGLSDRRYNDDPVVRAAMDDSLAWQPENGESWRAVQTRVETAWQQLRNTVDGDTVVVVAHTGPIHCLLAAVGDRPLATELAEEHIPEASVARLSVDADGATIAARDRTPSR